MVKVGDLLYCSAHIGPLVGPPGIHVVLSVTPDDRGKKNSIQYDEVRTMAPDGQTGRFWIQHDFPEGGSLWRRVDL